MNISSIQSANQSTKIQQQAAAAMQKVEKADKSEKNDVANKPDSKASQAEAIRAELGINTSKKNYKIDSAKVAELKAQFSQQASSFQAMISKMFEQQGITYNQANSDTISDLLSKITVDPATKAKAAEAVSETGYWGVEQTSARILDFAKAISGGDPSKIETLKNAFERGFEEAAKKFGKLPDISPKTYDAVMKGFDAWEKDENNVKSEAVEETE